MTAIAEPIQETEAPSLPAPGLYPGVDFRTYVRWPALSKSTLEWGLESILHLKAATDGKLSKPDSPAFAFGRALHCRLLEPLRYRSDFATLPNFEQDTPGKYKNYKATDEYKAKEAAFYESHEHCEIITGPDALTIELMARSVYDHPAVNLFHAAGGCEVSATWTDAGTGLSLKGRLDKFIPEFGKKKVPVIIDIKTTKSCHPDSLSKDIMDYGYARQCAIYKSGIEEIVGVEPDFLFVFIEKTFPHASCVAHISDASVAIGRQQITGVLQQWNKAQETGIYPAFGLGILSLDLPAYEMRKWNSLD